MKRSKRVRELEARVAELERTSLDVDDVMDIALEECAVLYAIVCEDIAEKSGPNSDAIRYVQQAFFRIADLEKRLRR